MILDIIEYTGWFIFALNLLLALNIDEWNFKFLAGLLLFILVFRLLKKFVREKFLEK